MIGAASPSIEKCCAKRPASMVADVMMTFRSRRRGSKQLEVAKQKIDVQ